MSTLEYCFADNAGLPDVCKSAANGFTKNNVRHLVLTIFSMANFLNVIIHALLAEYIQLDFLTRQAYYAWNCGWSFSSGEDAWQVAYIAWQFTGDLPEVRAEVKKIFRWMQKRVCACELDLDTIRSYLNISAQRFAEASYCNTEELVRYEECVEWAEAQVSMNTFDELLQECLWSDST